MIFQRVMRDGTRSPRQAASAAAGQTKRVAPDAMIPAEQGPQSKQVRFLPTLPLLLILAGCATPRAGYRPLPQLHLQTFPPRSAESTNAPPPKFSACLVWQVPTGIVVKAWVVQSSSNLVDFVDMPGNWDCSTPGVQMTNPAGFYRLKGIR